MKAYWDEQNHKLVFDLDGQEIKGDFTNPISGSDIVILNGVFLNTATKFGGKIKIGLDCIDCDEYKPPVG